MSPAELDTHRPVGPLDANAIPERVISDAPAAASRVARDGSPASSLPVERMFHPLDHEAVFQESHLRFKGHNGTRPQSGNKRAAGMPTSARL